MKDYFNQIHKTDNAILEEYLSHWEEFSLPKNTIMTAEGSTQHHLLFVTKGLQKSYYLNNGKEHIIAFTYAPSFSGIPESFLTQKPSKYFLETITDSEFLRISYSKHKELILKHRQLETLFRVWTEQLLIGILDRYYELMAYDIETRFRNFLQRSPHMINMVSQKDLASYLRIDPTNFSKLIRNVQI